LSHIDPERSFPFTSSSRRSGKKSDAQTTALPETASSGILARQAWLARRRFQFH